jgi:membrane-bound metal-dependent hydrolase YbcI (DUF457 family)
MTAGHFAAALAIKSRVPKASTVGLILAAFLPDFIWIILAVAGIEPTRREVYFDDWSHSLFSILVYALLFILLFWKQGRPVAFAMGAAVFSHFLLDLPVHPKDLALYPHSPVHLGFGLSDIDRMRYWYIQLITVLFLLAIYFASAYRLGVSVRWIIPSCVLVLGWHLVLMQG